MDQRGAIGAHANETGSARTCALCSTPLLAGTHFCSHCGAPQIAAVGTSQPLSQTLLPYRYEPIRFLGQGSMGRVFLCRDRDLDVRVAVKVLPSTLVSSPEAAEHLRGEAQSAARFREHPGILSLYTFERHEGMAFLVMEYAEGGSLRKRLQREKCLPETECRRIGAQIARALGYAHRRDMLHRDVKPGNILLDRNGRARVGDFGLAKALADFGSTATESIMGTPVYMAPEILADEPVDGRADLYSLGCTLYEMATGELPFKGSFPEVAMAKIRPDAQPPDPLRVRPGLSGGFVSIVRRLLRRNPEERYAGADECAKALDGGGAASLGMTTTVEPIQAASKDTSLAHALFKKGVRAQNAAQFAEAHRLLCRALSLHKRVFGQTDPVVARDLQYLARNHYLQHRYEQAERPFAHAVRIRSDALGAKHPEIAHDWSFLARLYTLQGKYRHARAAYRRALGIMEASLGTGHFTLVRVLSHLGVCYVNDGAAERAEPYLERARRIATAVKGRAHPAVARVLNHLAAMHLGRDDHSACEATLEEALGILERAHGDAHESMLDTLDLYAALCRRRNDAAGAARVRERAGRIRSG